MGYFETSALILRTADYGESDKLITFYSPDLGRATGIAKGAKRSKKLIVNKLETFTLLTITCRLRNTSGLVFISEAELDNSYLLLRQDYRRYTAATLISELVVRLTRDQDPDDDIFQLLLWALNSLESAKSPLQTAALFNLRLMELAGYRPELEQCGSCNKQIDSGQNYIIHPASGALLCMKCSKEQGFGQATAFSLQTIKFMQKGQRSILERLDRLHLPPKVIHEALHLLYKYTRHLLQQDIHSYKSVLSLSRSNHLRESAARKKG